MAIYILMYLLTHVIRKYSMLYISIYDLHVYHVFDISSIIWCTLICVVRIGLLEQS